MTIARGTRTRWTASRMCVFCCSLLACAALGAMPTSARAMDPGLQGVAGAWNYLSSGSPCLVGSVGIRPYSATGEVQVQAIGSVSVLDGCGGAALAEPYVVISLDVFYFDVNQQAWMVCPRPGWWGYADMVQNSSAISGSFVTGSCPRDSWLMAQVAGMAFDQSGVMYSGVLQTTAVYYH